MDMGIYGGMDTLNMIGGLSSVLRSTELNVKTFMLWLSFIPAGCIFDTVHCIRHAAIFKIMILRLKMESLFGDSLAVALFI